MSNFFEHFFVQYLFNGICIKLRANSAVLRETEYHGNLRKNFKLASFFTQEMAKMQNLRRNKKITRNDFFLSLETLIQFIILIKSILSMLKMLFKFEPNLLRI